MYVEESSDDFECAAEFYCRHYNVACDSTWQAFLPFRGHPLSEGLSGRLCLVTSYDVLSSEMSQTQTGYNKIGIAIGDI